MSHRQSVPSYRLHKQSGQAVVTLTDNLGNRRDKLLGKHGTAESRAEYLRVIAEWEAAGRRFPPSVQSPAVSYSVNEVIVAYWKHAEAHYRRPDGTPTNELAEYRQSFKPLKALYGMTPAASFGPLALKAVRLQMVEAGLARGVINQRIGRIRRMFKWAVSEELVPPSVYQALSTVRGLERGRSEAKETVPVKPVSLAFVEATLPHVPRQVEAILQLMRHTGMRPGEACIIRGIDLDTGGAVWLYRPGSDQGPHGQHKTAWRGHDRVIAIGPRGQAVLKPWLRLNVEEYLFQPREAEDSRNAQRRAERKSPMTPSQRKRKRKARPQRTPGDHYDKDSLGHAVRKACKKADVPPWAPNQLRHTFATEVRRQYGIEAAQVLLGHARADVTQVYAEKNLGLAARVAAEIG